MNRNNRSCTPQCNCNTCKSNSCGTVKSCSTGCELYTGEVEGSDFDNGLKVVSSNVGLITVDSDFLKIEDITRRNDCGKLFGLPISNGSNITLSDSFKEQIKQIIKALTLQNVGTSEVVYKGPINGVHQFKGLKAGNAVQLSSNANDITIGVDPSKLTKTVLTSKGSGNPILKNTGTDTYTVASLKAKDSSINISEEPDGAISIKANGTTVESVGNGTQLSKIENNIAKIKSIKSTTLDIQESVDGTIKIEYIPVEKEFGYLKSYYVNSSYRPTADSPSDGSIIRPYTTYDEAKNAIIGNGTVYAPQNSGIIIMQSNSTTSENPTFNGMHIMFQGNYNLIYKGDDEYMIDTELLYNHPDCVKDSYGIPSRRIRITLGSYEGFIGTLRRVGTGNYNTGILRAWGCNRAGLVHPNSSRTNDIKVDIINNLSLENNKSTIPPGTPNYPMFDSSDRYIADLYGVDKDSNYRVYTGLTPKQPVLDLKYNSYTNSSFPMFARQKLRVYITHAVGISVEKTYIPVTDLTVGVTSSAMPVDDPNARSYDNSAHVPCNWYNVMEIKDKAVVYIDNFNFGNNDDSFWHGPNSIIKMYGGTFSRFRSNFWSNQRPNAIIDLVDVDLSLGLGLSTLLKSKDYNSGRMIVKAHYLIKVKDDVGTNRTINFRLPNSEVGGFKDVINNTNQITMKYITYGKFANFMGRLFLADAPRYDNRSQAQNTLNNIPGFVYFDNGSLNLSIT